MKVNNMIFSPSKLQKGPSGSVQNRALANRFMQNNGMSDNSKEIQLQQALNATSDTFQGVKSPFKTLVKQQPVEADASVVPMETETNVKDDDEFDTPYYQQKGPSLS
jgi:hypothetical protein